jgi:LysR family hydrogen peroxide-inducible transcriptional activator
MDLRQLAALVAVADHGSFTAAARALFTAQSNVSAHVARLEREVGAVLWDRTHGRLTDEGHLVVDRARRVQAELDALHGDLASRGDQVTGEVRLGMIGTTARWIMPRFLHALRQRHPGVRTIIVDASTTSLLPQLVGGRLDLAVTNLPVDDPDIDTERLFDEDLMLLVTTDHVLAGRADVDLAGLVGIPLLLPAPGTALRGDIDAEATRLGVTLEPAAEVDGVRLLTSLAFEGFAAAIVPATAVPGWLKGDFTRVPLLGLPRRQVGLAWRRRTTLSAPARAVAELLREVVATRGPRQPGVHTATVARRDDTS